MGRLGGGQRDKVDFRGQGLVEGVTVGVGETEGQWGGDDDLAKEIRLPR